MDAPIPASPCELCSQRIEPLGPEVSERLQPSIDVLQRAGLDGVQATGALGSHASEAALTEDPQMLGHCRLGDPELRADDRDDLTGRLLLVDEQFENPPADRISEDIERMHGMNLSSLT